MISSTPTPNRRTLLGRSRSCVGVSKYPPRPRLLHDQVKEQFPTKFDPVPRPAPGIRSDPLAVCSCASITRRATNTTIVVLAAPEINSNFSLRIPKWDSARTTRNKPRKCIVSSTRTQTGEVCPDLRGSGYVSSGASSGSSQT
jgi:hypothetical protein